MLPTPSQLTLGASICAAVVACAFPAISDPIDTLSEARLTAIHVAYEDALRDPEHHVDALSPRRTALILAAYDAEKAQDSDRLSAGRWAVMQKAYRTHDPKGIQFAAR